MKKHLVSVHWSKLGRINANPVSLRAENIYDRRNNQLGAAVPNDEIDWRDNHEVWIHGARGTQKGIKMSLKRKFGPKIKDVEFRNWSLTVPLGRMRS